MHIQGFPVSESSNCTQGVNTINGCKILLCIYLPDAEY